MKAAVDEAVRGVKVSTRSLGGVVVDSRGGEEDTREGHVRQRISHQNEAAFPEDVLAKVPRLVADLHAALGKWRALLPHEATEVEYTEVFCNAKFNILVVGLSMQSDNAMRLS